MLDLGIPAYNSTADTSPSIAIVGRPNVGKSTLFNRIVGSRRAIVGDEPGITRDRLYGDAEWNGHKLRIVDTGGILPEEKDFIPAEIYRQARVALEEAAAIVMVVDGRTELAGPDLELVRLLSQGKPSAVRCGQQDRFRKAILSSERLPPAGRRTHVSYFRGAWARASTICWMRFWWRSPQTFTTEDTEGTEESADAEPLKTPAREVKVAIIGHPNVGKSTLLNRLTLPIERLFRPSPEPRVMPSTKWWSATDGAFDSSTRPASAARARLI